MADDVRAFLKRDHARIEGLHARLMDELDRERPNARSEMWRRLETAVLGHMRTEERYLLRRFGRAHRRDAARLRAQHAHLRRALADIGTDVDAHRQGLERFIEELCVHARSEDRLLYAWAQDEVDSPTRERIARAIAACER